MKTNHYLRGLLEKAVNLSEESGFRGTFREKENGNGGGFQRSDGRASREKQQKKGTGSYGIIPIVF